MKYKYLVALVVPALCDDLVMPPKAGKFFYTDFLVGDDIEVHYVELKLGKNSLQKFWVSTQQQQVGVFTTSCPDSSCNMPDKWDPANSPSAVIDNLGRTDMVLNSNFDKKSKITSIQDIYVTGGSYTESVTMQFQEFNRQSVFK